MPRATGGGGASGHTVGNMGCMPVALGAAVGAAVGIAGMTLFITVSEPN